MPDFPYKLVHAETGEKIGIGKALNICCEEHFLAACEQQAEVFAEEFGVPLRIEPMDEDEYDADPFNAEMEDAARLVVDTAERAANASLN